jgi:hypothetical protein
MTKKKSDGETLSEREIEILEENVLLKSKLGFALGVLEAVQILTKQSTPEILEKNLEHLRLTIPRSIEDIKSGLIHFN